MLPSNSRAFCVGIRLKQMNCRTYKSEFVRLRRRHAEFRSLFLQPGIECVDHLFRPFRIDLSGCVLTFAQHRMAPLIDQAIHFGVVGYFFSKLRRNESDSFGIADRDVARHHRDFSDSNGNVDSGQHYILQRGRIDPADVALESWNLLNAGYVSHRAVHDQAVVALGVDRGREIVADDCAVTDFSEEIDDQNVSGLQNVDDPGVFVAKAAFFFSVGANDGVDIGTLRHEDRRDHAANEPRSGVDHLPSAFELVAVAGVLQHVPSLVGSHVLEAGQNGIRDMGTSVGKAVAVPLRSEFDPLLFRKKAELRVGRKKCESEGAYDSDKAGELWS